MTLPLYLVSILMVSYVTPRGVGSTIIILLQTKKSGVCEL